MKIMRRSRDTIISEILETCLHGATKTKIVYRVNLNFRTINPYLDLLIKNDLLLQLSGPKTIYETTDKGRELLNEYDQTKMGGVNWL